VALKKPTDFFAKNNNNKVNIPTGSQEIPEKFDAYKSNVKNIETLNEFTEVFGSFKENITKIELLESTIEELKKEISKSLSQEDLDNAMMVNLLILEDNIKKIESKIKGINRKDLSAIYEEVEDITKKVSYVFEQELPKYKSVIKNNEISFDKKLISYQETVEEKLEDFIDNFESQIQEKFVVLENELEGINEQSLSQINSNVNELTELVHQELPKYKKQVVDNSLKTEEKINSVYETLEDYQKEVYERVETVQKAVHNLIEQEVPKYQDLLVSAKISNDEKIKEITEELVFKINSLTDNAQKLNEEVEEKSIALESSFQDKITSLESHILITKKDIEETSTTYKKLYHAIEAKGLAEKIKFDDHQQLIEGISKEIKDVYENFGIIKEEVERKSQEQIEDLRKLFNKKLNLLENDIEHKNNKLKEANSTLLDNVFALKEQVNQISFDEIDEKYNHISKKVSYIEEVFNQFNEKTILNEGLLNEPPALKNTDPLTPTNQNFVTLDQLQEHYRLFINRVQQQLATLGGGGETRLEFLDDVDRNSVKTDGYVLSYQASTGKFIGTEISGGGGESFWSSTASGISTISNVGIGITADSNYKLFVEGDAFFTGNVSVAGTVTYDDVTNVDSVGFITARSGLLVGAATTFTEDLVVEGNARVTGILTVGTSSIVLDGDNNTITAGEVFITGSSITLGDDVVLNAGASGINSAPNVLYVAKDGSDEHNGTSIDNAKLTIAGAVAIAQTETVIKVLSGTYNENNPIEVPAFVSIVGDSLKTVTVVPNNSTEDIFHVNKGTYLAHMTFTGHVAPSAAVAFPPDIATNVGGGSWESPYIQNCTSNTTTGTGMRIDGNLAEELKSMVVDAYTQYNQGGVGIAITNNGYAQLVSVFTICCNESITVHKGGQCSLTNSNTDFGSFGLVADGVSDLQFTGIVSTSAAAGQDSVTIGITTTTRPYNGQVVYFDTLYNSINTIEITNGGSGYTTTPTVSIAAPTGPNGTTATAFATLDGDTVSSITVISSGNQYTSAPSVTISAPDSGTTATASATLSPIYYTINSSTPIVDGVVTLSLEENLINSVGVGATVYFYQVSKITATSHTFEYVGSGNTITTAVPSRGGVAIQENEIIERNGGRVTFTSTDQSGNFRIGNDIVINQNNGTISGRAFTRSLFNQMTPFILALS
jgi:hypothetical protein